MVALPPGIESRNSIDFTGEHIQTARSHAINIMIACRHFPELFTDAAAEGKKLSTKNQMVERGTVEFDSKRVAIDFPQILPAEFRGKVPFKSFKDPKVF